MPKHLELIDRDIYMQIGKSIFGSKRERKVFEAIKDKWQDRFNIYPSLPFGQIINFYEGLRVSDKFVDADLPFGFKKSDLAIRLTKKEKQFLKTTSVDYTLCSKQDDAPILSIEFDGMGNAFSKGDEVLGRTSPVRQLKLNLKLKVARSVGYSLFVISSKELELADKLTVLDYLIGNEIAHKTTQSLINERVEEEKIFLDGLPKNDAAEIIQDIVLDCEFEANLMHNPVTKQIYYYESTLWNAGIKFSEGIHWIDEPGTPQMTHLTDFVSLVARVEYMKNQANVGCMCEIVTDDSLKFSRTVWIRDVGSLGASISSDIAKLLALKDVYKYYSKKRKV